LGEEALRDETGEELDRRALRADDLAADDPLDDLEVPRTPDDRALVELGQRLGQLVKVLELAAATVEVDAREPGFATALVECLTERRDSPAELVPARRVEAAAMAEHRPDLGGVLPRRKLLQHVELLGDEPQAQRDAPQQTE